MLRQPGSDTVPEGSGPIPEVLHYDTCWESRAEAAGIGHSLPSLLWPRSGATRPVLQYRANPWQGGHPSIRFLGISRGFLRELDLPQHENST